MRKAPGELRGLMFWVRQRAPEISGVVVASALNMRGTLRTTRGKGNRPAVTAPWFRHVSGPA